MPVPTSVTCPVCHVAVAVGSMSIMAFNAQPGDPLWNVNQSIFGGESTDIDLVSALERDLAAANDALSRGDTAKTDRLLQSVSERLDGVESAADRVNLIRIRDQIQRQLDRGPAAQEVCQERDADDVQAAVQPDRALVVGLPGIVAAGRERDRA